MNIVPCLWPKQRYGIGGAVLLIALLSACNAPQAAPPPSASGPVAAPASPAPGTPESTPASTAPKPSGDESSLLQQEAVQVIRNYYSAINRRDYSAAYALWQGDGIASQQTLEQFERGFTDTVSVAVDVGDPGPVDGAAGSLYIEIPVTVTAVTGGGTPQRFRGSYVLRRVNDVPGATPEQLQWHLYSGDVAQVR
ncbi:hypothetical protein [Nodosilinea nodulosa]|uniref:hypothetical protein n=1 Tax=Nodosilinea nodulosa TaxID=416001 RepID=UPI000310AD45|nr:hypothetical protein [Nodosilinea nodulosa]